MKRKYTTFLNKIPTEWLVAGDPFTRYNTLLYLLGNKPNDKEVIAAKAKIAQYPPVKKILRRQNAKGFWGISQDIFKWWPRKETTFWVIGMLADFGFTNDNRKMARACEYIFSTQHDSGGFGWAPPHTPADCFTGILTESLAKAGYSDDSRLKSAYRWLLQRQRLDGGFWCKNTGLPGNRRQHEPSCPMATLFVLGAFSQISDYAKSQTARRAADFLLGCWDNREEIKYAGHDSQIGKGWDRLKYPFTDYKILKYLDVLTQYEFIKSDPRINAIIDVLISRMDSDGKFRPESIHKCWSDFDFGRKKSPSRWITFLAYRIIKRMI